MAAETEIRSDEIDPHRPAIVEYYQTMFDMSNAIMEESFADPGRVALHGKSHLFVEELEKWVKTIQPRPEAKLISRAAREYQFALLALALGHYQHAFKGLRLVLELTLQTVHLSAHTLDLHEWLAGRKDTNWSELMADNGVFSKRYADAFYPDLRDHVAHFRGLSERLYRECSEAVHGNVRKHIPMPDGLQFDRESFKIWHDKADIMAMAVTFALVLRYLHQISTPSARLHEPAVMQYLGHISAVRHSFGATGGE